jgi:Phosphodiester glycosidase
VAIDVRSPRAVRVGSSAAARRRRRVRRLAFVAVAALLAPVLYSYVSTMLQPSSLPLGIRSVEWIRAHHGAWVVDHAEQAYYSWKAPAKGGPALTALPTLGRSARAVAAAHAPKRTTHAVSSYRPARIRPRVLPALPGEGAWHATGVSVAGAPPVLVSDFRPDPSYPRNLAYVAWIDHTRTQLALYPGRYEPPSNVPRGPMSVPYGQRWRLLATFNSGFTYRDGHGGFALNGVSFTPLTRGMATLVGYRNGRVDVVSWHGGATPGRNVVLARQNLPLLVSGGRPSANLSNGSSWGATLGNAIRVWRSGVGVDPHGNLVYAAADYQTAASLAQILIDAGAVRAMELDINAEWPSLITYTHGGGLTPTKLVPNSQQSAQRYLVPDDRDFFAVYRRVPGRTAVPFR